MKNKQSSLWLSASAQSLNQGLGLGHKFIKLSKANFWHPLLADYFLGIRNGISLFNPQMTRKNMLKAFFLLGLILQDGGHILIVNTNAEFYTIGKNLKLLVSTHLRKLSHKKKRPINTNSSLSYCYYKWVGGTLTNWKQVSKSVLTFARFSEKCESFLIENNLEFPRYKKVKNSFEGLLYRNQGQLTLTFKEKPDLIFVVNPNENSSLLSEAAKLHIPVIALTESDTNIKNITYPIPINSYSAGMIYYFLKKITKMSSF
jgi:small subunit ribosomal protein S2